MTKKISMEKETWNEIFKTLFQVSGKVCERALYQGGVVRAVKLFKEKEVKNEKNVIDILKQENFIEDGEIKGNEIIISGSFEAEAFENSEKPVCFFLSGILGKLISFVRDEEIKVIEKACEAKGDEKCIFEIKELEWYEKMEEVMKEI